MKYIVLLCAFVTLLVSPVSAYELNVKLEDYVTTAETIAICRVEKDNGDGTVTVSITETLKGSLGEAEVIQGETGHCTGDGPVSRFMRLKNVYLVFLFKNNTVGRLGGILEIEEDKTLLTHFINGFTGTTYHKETHRRTLPVEQAKQQIKALLQHPNQ